LARLGRDTGQIYLVDPDGTLVLVTLSLEEAKDSGAYRNRALVPEIWVRTPGGVYLKAAASAHDQRTLNQEVIYWEPHHTRLHGVLHPPPDDPHGPRIQGARLPGRA
jgi:hypothetical protein